MCSTGRYDGDDGAYRTIWAEGAERWGTAIKIHWYIIILYRIVGIYNIRLSYILYYNIHKTHIDLLAVQLLLRRIINNNYYRNSYS